ncbi:MAG: hypothetical protein ACLP7J_08060 [Streptosporangiaceae bacterium]
MAPSGVRASLPAETGTRWLGAASRRPAGPAGPELAGRELAAEADRAAAAAAP